MNFPSRIGSRIRAFILSPVSAVGLALLLGAGVGLADTSPPTVAVGAAFPALDLKDQNGTLVDLPGAARWVLFADQRAVDEWADPVLAGLGRSGMDADGLVYLSDISRMPWLVSKLFALPQMRKRGYSVVLIRDRGEAARFPVAKDGCANLIGLKSGTVVSMEAVCSSPALKARLSALSSH